MVPATGWHWGDRRRNSIWGDRSAEEEEVVKLLRKYWMLVLILGLGIFLRGYKMTELFMYSHDQDLASWFVADIVENWDWRLIGQETSVRGIFIGPLYYYLLIPFYLLFGMDPIGGVVMSLVVSAVAIVSYYWVFAKIFSKRAGLVVSTLYAASLLVVMTDREAVPTMSVMLWSVWWLYGLWLVLESRQKVGFLVLGVLAGLIWHLNLGLMILIALVPVAYVLAEKRDWRAIGWSGWGIGILSLPLALFEWRHGFIQVRALAGSLAASEELAVSKLAKLDRVMQLTIKNTYRLFGTDVLPVDQMLVFLGLIIVLVYLVYRRVIEWRLGLMVGLWLAIFIGFFTVNSINLSEYYLNGMVPAFLLVAGVGIVELGKRQKWLMFVVIGLFLTVNINKILSIDVNRSGYIDRKAIVAEIKADSKARGYPCVAVSHIAEPGRDLGYRYLFRLEKMHVNQPKSEAPVYTIVFPHSMVDRIDKSFGALGLIYPDYERYSSDGVAESCSGENANLTDPLFGYLD